MRNILTGGCAARGGWLCLAICFIFCVWFLHHYIGGLLNSDMSSELLLARVLHEEGSLVLSSGWFYSTELRVLNTQLVFAPLFGFTSDWHLIRVAGTALLWLAMLASFYVLAHALRLARLFPWLALGLILPVGTEYFFFVLGAPFYVPYICISFLSFGLLCLSQQKEGRPGNILLLCACALAVPAGMDGFRQFFVLYLPLLMGTLLFASRVIDWQACLEQGKPVWLKECPLCSRARQGVKAAACLCLAAGLGLAVNILYLRKQYEFQSHLQIRYQDLSAERLMSVLDSWLDAFGYLSGAEVFSWATAVNLLIMLALGALICVCRKMWTDWRAYPPEQVLLVCFFMAGVAFASAFYLFTDMYIAARYMLPLSIFAVPLLGAGIGLLPAVRLKTTGVACLAIFFLLVGSNQCKQLAGLSGQWRNPHGGRVHSYLFKPDMLQYFGRVGRQREIADFLVSKGYTQGYATFWNANVLTEMSDGALEVWNMGERSWQSEEFSRVHRWLQRKDHETRMPEGKVFVLVSAEERDASGQAVLPALEESHVIFRNDGYVVYGYDSMSELQPKGGSAEQGREAGL